MPPWEKYAGKPWEKYATDTTEPTAPDISKTETALRMAGQGASLGTSDEAAGVGSGVAAALHPAFDPDKSIAERFIEAYQSGRDDERKQNRSAEDANPKTALLAKLAGSALPAMATAGSSTLAEAPVATAAIMGGAQGAGESNADLTKGQVGQAALDTGKGALTGAAIAKLITLFPALGKYLGGKAENMAEKATGATRVQAQKFQPGTGRELLDRDIVTFGSSPSGVAEKAQEGLKVAGGNIDAAIAGMDKGGQIIDKEAVIKDLEGKISSMASDPSKAPIITKIMGYIDDIRNTPSNVESVAGDVEGFTPSLAENTKRGYQSLANYNDPEKTQAIKAAADVFKTQVEGAAEKASPEIAEQFARGKKDWGLLAPVEEAASNRAEQLKQSPLGGFLDTTAAAAGAVAKGGLAAVPAAVARRTLAPRLASSLAVTGDVASKVLQKPLPPVITNILSRLPETLTSAPESKELPENQEIPIERMGKFSGPLMKAKERGPDALSRTSFILSQTNPEYRDMLKQQKGESNE